MNIESQKIRLRWSDLDPNFHLKHSSYYDLASQYRMEVIEKFGISMDFLEKEQIVPILLREKCRFLREIRYQDSVTINFKIIGFKESGIEWRILHEFIDGNNKLKAKLTVDIAWFNIRTRKLLKVLPESIRSASIVMATIDDKS